MSLRLASSGEDTESTKPGEPAVEDRGEVEALQDGYGPGESDERFARATVGELVKKLDPRILSGIAKHVSGARRRPGRPKGSGRKPDEPLLALMADLIVKEPEKSERKAADAIAIDHPGHSAKATARRLRRKFGEDRDRLLEAARMRLRRRKMHRADDARRTKRADRPAVRRSASSPPIASMAGTSRFLGELQEKFGIDQELIERLRAPYMLEEIARLHSLTLFSEAAGPSADALAAAGLIEDPMAAAVREISPMVDAMRVVEPAVNVARSLEPWEDATRSMENRAARVLEPWEDATRTMTSLAATDLSTRMPTTRELGYNRAATTDITGLEEMTRQLNPIGELNRRVNRLAKPWSDDD